MKNDFRLVKLGLICKIQSGGTPRRGVDGYYGGSIPWAKIGDIENAEDGYIFNTKETITDQGLKSINNRIFPADTVFLAMYGSVGKTAIAGKQMATNQAILGLQPKDTSILYNRYLKYWIDYSKNNLLNKARGVALQNISATIVKELEIILPSLEEQKRIVKMLDHANSLRQKRKQTIDLSKDYLKSVFLEMFGDPVKNTLKYPLNTLDEVSHSIFLGLTSKVDYVETGGFPLIRATDINGGKLSFDKVKFISNEQHKLITKNRITKRGDVLVSKSGSLGTCAIVDTDTEFTTYESIITIQSNKQILNNYFLIYLLRNENFQIKILGRKVGGTVSHLNLAMFRNIEIPIPPISDQAKFANIYEKTESLKQKMLAQSKELETQFQSLMQRSFHEAL